MATTRTYTRVADQFDTVHNRLHMTEGWLCIPTAQIPGLTTRDKQRRLHKEMHIRRAVIDTRTDGDQLLVRLRPHTEPVVFTIAEVL